MYLNRLRCCRCYYDPDYTFNVCVNLYLYLMQKVNKKYTSGWSLWKHATTTDARRTKAKDKWQCWHAWYGRAVQQHRNSQQAKSSQGGGGNSSSTGKQPTTLLASRVSSRLPVPLEYSWAHLLLNVRRLFLLTPKELTLLHYDLVYQ